MKKSGIMLAAGAGFVIIVLLALTVFFRLRIADFTAAAVKNSSSIVSRSGIMKTKDYNFSDFNQLHFDDMWNVSIKGGDHYSVTVEADEKILDNISIERKGKELFFSYDGNLINSKNSGSDVQATIVMPDLKKLEITGMGQMELHNFNLDELSLLISGASSIGGSGVSVNQLDLIVNGAANAELNSMDIRNCRLNISGAASIQLNMTGGELTGQVSGAASVLYKGSVSNESVSLSGLGSLKRR